MRDERGAVLLEVLIALAILATAGAGLVGTVTEHLRAVQTIRSREPAYRSAEAIITRLALEDRRGLDIRIGQRTVGAFITDVQRPRPGLYRLAVSAAAAPDVPLFVTVVYRGVEQ